MSERIEFEPEVAYCDQGHPGHDHALGCGPCRDEETAGLGERAYAPAPGSAQADAFDAWAKDHGLHRTETLDGDEVVVEARRSGAPTDEGGGS